MFVSSLFMIGTLFLLHFFSFRVTSHFEGRIGSLSIWTSSTLTSLINFIVGLFFSNFGYLYYGHDTDLSALPPNGPLLTRYGHPDRCETCNDVEFTTIWAMIHSLTSCVCSSKNTLTRKLLDRIDDPFYVIVIFLFIKNSSKNRDTVILLLLNKLRSLQLNLFQQMYVRVAIWFMTLNAMCYIITFYHCFLHVAHNSDVNYVLQVVRRYSNLYRYSHGILPEPRLFFSLLWSTLLPEEKAKLLDILAYIHELRHDRLNISEMCTTLLNSTNIHHMAEINRPNRDWVIETACLIPLDTDIELTLKRRFIIFLSWLWRNSIDKSKLHYSSA